MILLLFVSIVYAGIIGISLKIYKNDDCVGKSNSPYMFNVLNRCSLSTGGMFGNFTYNEKRDTVTIYTCENSKCSNCEHKIVPLNKCIDHGIYSIMEFPPNGQHIYEYMYFRNGNTKCSRDELSNVFVTNTNECNNIYSHSESYKEMCIDDNVVEYFYDQLVKIKIFNFIY